MANVKVKDNIKTFISKSYEYNTAKEVQSMLQEKYNIDLSIRSIRKYSKSGKKKKFDDSIKTLVKELRDNGYLIKQIKREVFNMKGVEVSESTIQSWCSEDKDNELPEVPTYDIDDKIGKLVKVDYDLEKLTDTADEEEVDRLKGFYEDDPVYHFKGTVKKWAGSGERFLLIERTDGTMATVSKSDLITGRALMTEVI